MRGVIVAVLLLLVLAFAVLGVRDTLATDGNVALRVASGIVRLLVIALATIGLLDTLRGSALQGLRVLGGTERAVPVSHPVFRTTMELLTGTPLTPGNTVRMLRNGDETYPALWADLRRAERSIAIQLYYCEPGRMATGLRDILVERARAGVSVFLLVDAFGAEDLPTAYFDTLREAGVEVAMFRPLRWMSLNRANTRSHVRVVAVDGAIGYTGGFGIADKWYGDGRSADEWRETNVRFTGPAVGQLLATFVVGWAEATGRLLTVDAEVAATLAEAAGGAEDRTIAATEDTESNDTRVEAAGLLHTAPTLGSTRAERYLSLSIEAARERLYVSNAYFVPSGYFRRLLEQAAARGVDVRILTAGPGSDVPTTWFAGRARYARLLDAGVRVYGYAPSMMHTKTMVVDGRWVSIGSMNFDNRSLVFNDEANFVALDPTLGGELDAMFMADLAHAREITAPTFARRPWWHRPLELGADLLTRVL